MQVNANAVVLRVAVEEHPELEEGVRTVFDSGDHASWREGCLLDISVVIFGVFVEVQLAESVQLPQLSAKPYIYLGLEKRIRTGNCFFGQTFVTSNGSNPSFLGSASSGFIICTCAVQETCSPFSIACQRSRFEKSGSWPPNWRASSAVNCFWPLSTRKWYFM